MKCHALVFNEKFGKVTQCPSAMVDAKYKFCLVHKMRIIKKNIPKKNPPFISLKEGRKTVAKRKVIAKRKSVASPRKKYLKVKQPTPGKKQIKRLSSANRMKIPLRQFCGKYGGADPRSYPVDTPGRAKIAIAYAYKAPNPQGIKDCAKRALERMKKNGIV